MNVDNDRLSRLSDDLINKILSYNDTKHAIRTSILSSRWKNIWKSIPHLDFYNDYYYLPFRTLCKYVTHVMSSRNNEVELMSIKLRYPEEVDRVHVSEFMRFAFSHNVQKLTIICRSRNKIEIEFPLSSFISESLKDFTLIGYDRFIFIKSSWDLLALTTLHLDNVILNNYKYYNKYKKPDKCLYCKCRNLKNLTLTNCRTLGIVNVVAPHLKNLTVVNCKGCLIISTPELSSLTYEIQDNFELSSDGLSSLEKADFYIFDPDKEDAPKIIDMLQQFGNVKYLTLGLEIVEVLASRVELVSHLPSPFTNLMSFKIYPKNLHFSDSSRRSICSRKKKGGKKIHMPTQVKNYLLDGSPCATVTIFSREELQELENAKSAEIYMAELKKLLEEQKINCETKVDMNDQGDTQNDVEEQLVEEEISHINERWYDLFEQIKDGGFKINHILSMLRMIEDLLKNLPASKKDSIQARFYSLRAEAYSVIILITGSKITLGSAFMNSLQNLSF